MLGKGKTVTENITEFNWRGWQDLYPFTKIG